MDDALNTIFEQLNDAIGGFTDTVIFGKVFPLLISISVNFGRGMLKVIDAVYNNLIKLSISFLTQNPKEWMGGAGWSTISSLNKMFVIMSLDLVVVFFLIGFFNEVSDVRSEIRLECILKSLIKMSVAAAFVQGAMSLVGAFFSLVGDLLPGVNAGSFSVNTGIIYSILNTYTGKDTVGAGDVAMVALLVLFIMIFLMCMLVIGALVLYQAFTRFFKVLVIVPYGALASSTLAGGQRLSGSAASFYKYALNNILEAVTMIMAIKLFSALSNTMLSYLATGDNALYAAGNMTAESGIGYIIAQLILAFTMYGIIKQSSSITQRALGL